MNTIDDIRARFNAYDALTEDNYDPFAVADFLDTAGEDIAALLARVDALETRCEHLEYALMEIWDTAHSAYYAASGNLAVQLMLQKIAKLSAQARVPLNREDTPDAD